MNKPFVPYEVKLGPGGAVHLLGYTAELPAETIVTTDAIEGRTGRTKMSQADRKLFVESHVPDLARALQRKGATFGPGTRAFLRGGEW